MIRGRFGRGIKELMPSRILFFNVDPTLILTAHFDHVDTAVEIINKWNSCPNTLAAYWVLFNNVR